MSDDCPMHKTIDLQLIEQAQSGRQEALSALSELARDKVYVFVYRLTLDPHLATLHVRVAHALRVPAYPD